MKNYNQWRKGMFDFERLTVQFGGQFSTPENIFEATAMKIPEYKYTVRERESLGGGWYGDAETVEKVQNNLYAIIKDGICIGQMDPYRGNIKSDLLPCNQQAMQFLSKNNIKYTREFVTFK